MPDIEKQLKLAATITRLRSELAAAEAEFAGTVPSKPRQPGPRGKGPTPSISERVLHVIRDAGPVGVSRRDLLAVLPNPEAVHSALKVHSRAGRIYSDGGVWMVEAPTRPTRPIVVQPEAPVAP